MKLKILSDGTRLGTKLYAESGEPIENVVLCSWNMSTEDELATAMVELIGVACEIITEYREIQVAPLQAQDLDVQDQDWNWYRGAPPSPIITEIEEE